MSKSACRGLNLGKSAPNRSMSYGDIESEIYSMAQQAVAQGYGNREYFRAQPTALSSRVSTTVSAKSLSCPNLGSAAGPLGTISGLSSLIRIIKSYTFFLLNTILRQSSALLLRSIVG